MNKRELIERMEGLKNLFGNKPEYVETDTVIELISELDESEKVTIPQSVADWIRKCKTFKSFAVSLSFALQPSVWEANGLSDESIEWLANAEKQEIFARAWLDGYEVEKEKRYWVKIRATKHCFAKDGNGRIFFSLAHKSCFTKAELEKADFGWVFDCPGIEIEEAPDGL